MSERRQQSWYVPLRVRFRSPAEQAQWEREHIPQPTLGDSNLLPLTGADVPSDVDIDAQRRTRQIKELLRLSNIMRAGLGLSEVLQQIVASTSACTGFRILVVHLQKKVLGCRSVDDPEDSKVPAVESIEVAELFANQAAIAIDNVRILQGKEAESQVLDKAIAALLYNIEQIQRGELGVRIH